MVTLVPRLSSSAGLGQQSSERFPELLVEDGVDDGVEEAVDVAQPLEQAEEDRIHLAGREVSQVVADADGLDDVECEERHPADEKHTCRTEEDGKIR